MKDIDTKNIEKKLKYLLKDKKLRNTKQRQQILKIFCFKKGHISVDDLYATVRMKYPNIGYATVHRTLKLFKKIGIAEEVKIDNQKALYEHKYKDDHHDHLVCIKCAKLIEISSEEIEYLQEKLAKKNNFKVLEHKLILYGVCKQCNKKI